MIALSELQCTFVFFSVAVLIYNAAREDAENKKKERLECGFSMFLFDPFLSRQWKSMQKCKECKSAIVSVHVRLSSVQNEAWFTL